VAEIAHQDLMIDSWDVVEDTTTTYMSAPVTGEENHRLVRSLANAICERIGNKTRA
jgi:hypothetical protein